jgi:hypothetical protein
MKITEDVSTNATEPNGTIQRDIKKWVDRLMLRHKGHFNPTRGIHS